MNRRKLLLMKLNTIMGGAGLTSYAQVVQAGCPVHLIDRASAGVRVLLENLATAAER